MDQTIPGLISALKAALRAEDDRAAQKAALRLLEVGLTDLHRIADALEILASPPAK